MNTYGNENDPCFYRFQDNLEIFSSLLVVAFLLVVFFPPRMLGNKEVANIFSPPSKFLVDFSFPKGYRWPLTFHKTHLLC